MVLPTRVLDLVGTISGHFLLPWLSGFERLTLQLVPKLEATLQAIFQDKAGWSSALATEFQPAVMCFYQVVDTYLDPEPVLVEAMRGKKMTKHLNA